MFFYFYFFFSSHITNSYFTLKSLWRDFPEKMTFCVRKKNGCDAGMVLSSCLISDWCVYFCRKIPGVLSLHRSQGALSRDTACTEWMHPFSLTHKRQEHQDGCSRNVTSAHCDGLFGSYNGTLWNNDIIKYSVT